MRFKIIFVIMVLLGIKGLYANNLISNYCDISETDTLNLADPNVIDSIIYDMQPESPVLVRGYYNFNYDTISHFNSKYSLFMEKVNAFEPVKIDSLTLQSNPFLTDLIYFDKPLNFKWDAQAELNKLLNPEPENGILSIYNQPFKTLDPYQIVAELRAEIRRRITLTSPELYAYRIDKLPDSRVLRSQFINAKPLTNVKFIDNDDINYTRRKLSVQKTQYGPWTRKANSMIQFSENYVSDNWYQGGSSNIAILGILSGQLNYDNKKNIQWENNAEWRAGFNTVEGDTIRLLNANDDNFKVYSKLGIKAEGNWFYSGSVDFSTQFFKNYKAVNSTVMKATFMTPLRLNVSVGFDYKYKKLFSLMLSPVSYKFIYASDIVNVSPKLFGIPEGEQVLSQIGSSFKAQFSYAPVREIQLDSKLSFYTNYEKVEIDWEIVGNFTINRYLSTRLSLNPRYDNTVILAAGEKAKIQFKELLSFGFSYKLLN
ncbi:MAG TPA: DUF3078 domain-containing protein [Paludibacter sp.]|nr:DUF3078 domain-containing protein [Paludibacter sp.]